MLSIKRRFSSKIICGSGTISRLPDELSRIDPYKICIITDENVERVWLDKIVQRIDREIHTIVLPSGEEAKDIDIAIDVWKDLADNRFTRKSVIIGLGGGVVCDISGYVASTYMRGAPLILIPTTLLAQVDAAIGGKNGVNLMGKNLIGTFYQPDTVIVDYRFVTTLPKEEILNAMAEIVKYGVIWDKDLFDYVRRNYTEIMELRRPHLSKVIERSIRSKVDIVLSDPYEDGLRRILNFGHTIGHAIELLSNYAVRHGYAVSAGMASACLVAEAKLRFRETDKLIEVLESIGLPTTINHPPRDIIGVLYLDKKAWHGDIVMVLPKYIGKVIVMPVSGEDILRALERLGS